MNCSRKRNKIYRLLPTKEGLQVEWIMDGCKKTRHCPLIYYEDMDEEFRSIIPKIYFKEAFLDHHLEFLHWRSPEGYLISRDARKIDYCSGFVVSPTR